MISYNSRIVTDGLVGLWDAKNPKSYPGTGTIWRDLINGVIFDIVGSPTYDSNGYFSFSSNQITQYIINFNFPIPTLDLSTECWFKMRSLSGWQVPYSYQRGASNTNDYILMANASSYTIFYAGNDFAPSYSFSTNLWYHIARTRVRTTGVENTYINGVLHNTRTVSAGNGLVANGIMAIGQEVDTNVSPYGFDSGQNLDGEFAMFSMYNRALTENEVVNNFNALRGRFAV